MSGHNQDREREEREAQQARIDALRDKANQLTGGKMVTSVSDDCPPHLAEQFWRNVVSFESAKQVPLFDQLIARGISLPAPEDLPDDQVHAKLWEVIHGLAAMRAFLDFTDHLSDRDLYTRLWRDALRVPEPVFEEGTTWRTHIDLSGAGGDPEETLLYLKYYADDEARDMWSEDFPDEELPEQEDPPYDRDRLLPQPTD